MLRRFTSGTFGSLLLWNVVVLVLHVSSAQNQKPIVSVIFTVFIIVFYFENIAYLVSQLVHLRPVGILNPVMFNLYVDLIIYSMALKSPDGELSLEIVFVLYCIVLYCIIWYCIVACLQTLILLRCADI